MRGKGNERGVKIAATIGERHHRLFRYIEKTIGQSGGRENREYSRKLRVDYRYIDSQSASRMSFASTRDFGEISEPPKIASTRWQPLFFLCLHFFLF